MIDKYSELAYSFSKDKTEAIEEANKAKEQMSSKFMFLFNNDERFRLYCSQKVLDLFGECTVHFMLVDSIGKGEQLSLFEKDKQKLNRQIGKELNIDSIE